MYDVAIIGSGPAGISAAINLKVLGKNFIWLSNGEVSKKLTQAERVKNYPGLPDVTGGELAWTFRNHTDAMNIKLCEEVITGVYDTGDKFTLLAGEREYEARAVILCTGVEAGKPIEGEDEFVGRGISYCATCDGQLYKDKTIAVLCTDKKFEHEVEFLAELSKRCYVMPMCRGYEIKSPKAEIILKNPVKFLGGMRLNTVAFKDGSIEVDGVFMLKGSFSPSTLVHGLRTQNGHIEVSRDCSTNIAGIFAAGDCTGRPYQYAKSVGEGNVAAHSAVEYLAKTKHNV